MPQKKFASVISAAFVLIALLFVAFPPQARSQEDGVYTVGSVLLNVLHVPFKLVTCVGTQVIAGVGYVATYGVEGNYEGGTNGKELGGYASGACKGPWIIRPEDVRRDYQ